MSKAELKKLKDEVMNKVSNIEALKEKLKEKSKEQETALSENKAINSLNIELSEKLGYLKIKIC
jgi:molybdopterin converting factor small subunit